jgi:hypothetical protein
MVTSKHHFRIVGNIHIMSILAWEIAPDNIADFMARIWTHILLVPTRWFWRKKRAIYLFTKAWSQNPQCFSGTISQAKIDIILIFPPVRKWCLEVTMSFISRYTTEIWFTLDISKLNLWLILAWELGVRKPRYIVRYSPNCANIS